MACSAYQEQNVMSVVLNGRRASVAFWRKENELLSEELPRSFGIKGTLKCIKL
jgi:hypothetical protein